MNDPIPGAVRWSIVLALAALAVVRPAAGPHVARVAVLALAGFALLPVVGWLRTLWFAPVAAAGLAAWAGATLLHHGHSVPIALILASGVGVAAGGLLAGAVRPASPSARPWWSLLAAVGVWAVLLPKGGAAAASAPVLFGVELASDRGLAILGLLLVSAALWATTHFARTLAGREIAAAGAPTDLALRCGADVRLAWLRAGAVSGLFAAWAGFLLVVDVQNVPSAGLFSPASAVVWLAAPLLGGAAWASGSLLGAVLVGGLGALLPVHEAVVAGLALVVAGTIRHEGLVGALRDRAAT